jgi:cytochrome c556
MRFIRVVAVAAMVTGFAGTASAQEAVIKLRQALMEVNQQSAGLAVNMIREQIPYDAQQLATAMLAISQSSHLFPTLFPDGSNVAPSKATPALWENRSEFESIAAKMVADAAAAAEAAAQGPEAFRAAFGDVGDNCQTCHEKYRQEN